MTALRDSEVMSTKSPIIERKDLISNIRNSIIAETGEEIDEEVIKKVLKAEEQEVLMAIANERRVKYVWGQIQGEEKAPKRVCGMFKLNKSTALRGGFSAWKRGVPKVIWSSKALECDEYDPGIYFDLSEHRYTSDARLYRKNKGLPELEEFEGLTEEKIKQICQKADNLELDKLMPKLRVVKTDNQLMNKKTYAGLRMMRELLGNPVFIRTDEPLDGESDTDIVDAIYQGEYLPYINRMLPENKLETIRRIIDIAKDFYNLLDKHPELIKEEKRLEKELKEKGIQEIPHDNFIKELKETGTLRPSAALLTLSEESRQRHLENKKKAQLNKKSSKKENEEFQAYIDDIKSKNITRSSVDRMIRSATDRYGSNGTCGDERARVLSSFDWLINKYDQNIQFWSDMSNPKIRTKDYSVRERHINYWVNKKEKALAEKEEQIRLMEEYDKKRALGESQLDEALEALYKDENNGVSGANWVEDGAKENNGSDEAINILRELYSYKRASHGIAGKECGEGNKNGGDKK